MGFHLGFLKIYLGFLEANLGFLSVVWGLSRINVQNPQLTLDHKPPLICRTLPWGFAGFIPVIRQLNAPICRTLTVSFTVSFCSYRQVSTTIFDKLYRGVSLIRFSDTGVATPYFVRGHANGNTTQIRRYDDGLVLYLHYHYHVLWFFYEMDLDRGISVWWFNLAGALQASRF